MLSGSDTALVFSASDRSSRVLFITPEELKSEWLEQKSNKVFIIDRNVFNLYEDLFKSLLDEMGEENSSPILLLQTKESKKDFTTLRMIIDFLTLKKITREDNIVAIGGGITLDITAFAASIYKRGCNLTLVPTSFLAMIDAAIGGKTGINYLKFKNLLGSFYPASFILIVPEFLHTLPEVEIKNGWAECIKIALLHSEKLYDLTLKDNSEITADIIREAILSKYHFCRQDLTDGGERQKLNLGHTFAHLIESASDYEIPHGLAVAIGIRAAARLSLKRGMITVKIEERIIKPLELMEFPGKLDIKYHRRLQKSGKALLEMDKKRGKTGQIILFTGFQKTTISTCNDPAELIEVLITLNQ